MRDIPPRFYLSKPHKITSQYTKPTLIPFSQKAWLDRFGIYGLTDRQMSKLMLTDVGLYSIAKPVLVNALVNLLKSIERKTGVSLEDSVAIETNAGLGGFTIPLSYMFKRVYAVEIDPLHCDIIRNNARVLKRSANIRVIKKDFLKYSDTLLKTPGKSARFIVSDPEWGGHDYKQQKNIRLGLSNVNIIHFIKLLAGRFDFFILLAPFNYDRNQLESELEGSGLYIGTHRAGRHYFVIVSSLRMYI
jgi:hypothetical protein